MRNSGPVEPGAIDSLQEVLADAVASGASLHIVHITSTCLREAPLCLGDDRRRPQTGTRRDYRSVSLYRGHDRHQLRHFGEGWKENRVASLSRICNGPKTGERLNAESFARYRKQGGMVAIHAIPEEIARLAVGRPES